MAQSQPNQRTTPAIQAAAHTEPVVVGIHGLPGSGKSFLLDQLKKLFGEEDFMFYEGSEVIARLVPGGLQRIQGNEGARAEGMAPTCYR